MTARWIWLPWLVAMTLAGLGCGDDSNGNGATGGTGGAGGSSGDAACTIACSSRCASVLPVADGDVAQCVGACEQSGILDGCETETANFVNCLEENDCPEVGDVCAGQAQDFGLCFNANAF